MKLTSPLLPLVLMSCGGSPDENVAKTTPADWVAPEVYGPIAIADESPELNVVEVSLTASVMKVDWVEAGETPVWAYNGQLPGPMIQARVGDLLRVNFTNDLRDPTTIHWHGLRIDNEMDGVPAVQDPIEPGESFTYEFVLPDAGTYWYHPHIRGNEQIDRGLYGGLIVHEREPVEVSRDRYFMLDDVALEENGTHYKFATNGMDGMHGRHGNYLLVNGQMDVLEDDVVEGAVERWRVVNTANARLMYIDVTGADWRVVGVDGGLLEEPYEAEMLRLPVGRRFDLEVIPRKEGGIARLRMLLPKQIGFDKYPMFEGRVLAPAAIAEAVEWPGVVLDEQEEPTQELEVVFDAESSFGGVSWTINGLTYGEGDPVPVSVDTPTRLIVRDESLAGHPFHLHGQFFEVVSRNGMPDDVPGPLDTIHVGGGDELELYTRFENPGLWMGHCHILEHAELGMMTSFMVE